MITEIYLLRHSLQIDKKLLNYDPKEKDQLKNEKLILSKEGEILAEEFSSRKEFQNIDLIYSSNYVRAIETAKYFSNDKIINIDYRLGERVVTEKIDNEFWASQFYNEELKTKNGESGKEVSKRMMEVMNEILLNNLGKRVLVVSHAAAITFFLLNFCKLIDLDYQNKSRILTYRGKEIINGPIQKPSAFKLTYKDRELDNVEYIK
ncbi:MAG: histidine phosphatase family protein [Bacilli bacterium]|nr:histidine phosphatase family protein [Bacilli bacterium]